MSVCMEKCCVECTLQVNVCQVCIKNIPVYIRIYEHEFSKIQFKLKGF